MDGLLNLLQKRQRGGTRTIRTLRQTQRVKSLFDVMVSKGYSRDYLNNKFNKLTNKDLTQYYGNEEYFIKDAAMYVIQQLPPEIFLYDGLVLAGFTEESAREAYEAIELLINTSYSQQQLYEIAINYLVSDIYEPLTSSKANYYISPETVGFSVEYKNTNIFNIQYKCENTNTVKDFIQTLLPPNMNLYYHATNWRSCLSILDGVNHNKGSDCLDFGYTNSFYLSPDLSTALRWGSANEKRFKKEIAIVVFAIQKIPSDINILEYKSPTKGWAYFVELSRKCLIENYNKLDDYDFVKGPILANPQKVIDKTEAPRAIKNSIQLASKTEEADKFLDSCLVGSFMFKKNP